MNRSSPRDPDQSDQVAEWIAAAREGSPAAQDQLLQACRAYLLEIANAEARGLRAKYGASDLVQDTFLKAVQKFEGFEGNSESEFLGWLRRILLNTIKNLKRTLHTEARDMKRELASTAGGESRDGLLGLLPACDPSPSSAMMMAERAQAVARAIGHLPENYRQAILCRHRDNLSFEEIGQVMSCSTEAARKLWSRAVEQLRQELGVSREPA